MAETYHAVFENIQFGNGKCMGGIFNGSGSGKIIKVYRININNASLTAVTGVIANLSLRTITAFSGHTAVTPVKHDSNNANLNANILVGHGATTHTLGANLRTIAWSTDEPVASGATQDEWQCLVPLNYLWDAGYGDANVQPLTLREGQGVEIYCATNTTAGYLYSDWEFTQE